MGRAARFLALGVAAFALGAAQPKDAARQPNDTAGRDVAESLQNIATTLHRANKPSEHDKPCNKGGEDRGSDLCAQWKAADAAKSSADATWAFGYVGSLLGLLTLAAAGAAAWYARKAAKAASDTVQAFTEVERAELVITLENFKERPYGEKNEVTGGLRVTGAWLEFDVVANNLGRSSGLITQTSSAWYDSPEPDAPIFLGMPKKYIVNPGKSAVLKLSGMKDAATLKTERFLFVNVSYKSPLRDDERIIRTCFEVFGINSDVHYRERRHEDWGLADLRKGAPNQPNTG